MTKKLIALLIIVAVFVAGWYLFFYRGVYSPPSQATVVVEGVSAPAEPSQKLLDTPPAYQGVLLIDNAHLNTYQPEELNVLLAQVVGRGFRYDFWESEEDLSAQLRAANAVLIPVPNQPFSPEEVRQLKDFVRTGGRLLLIADPTRNREVIGINSLAASFDILYAGDYVYNMSENEGNYRNVIFRDFSASPVTDDLEAVVFYSAHSMDFAGQGIILGDARTFSSQGEPSAGLTVAALTTGGNVLALPDLTFMSEPYSAVRDNLQLVDNIADFLTSGQKAFSLADYPHFFKHPVDLVYADSSLFSQFLIQNVSVKEGLEKDGKVTEFRDQRGEGHDLFFVGLYEDADQVEEYLTSAGIAIVEEGANQETPTVVATRTETSPAPGTETTPTVALFDKPTPQIEEDFIAGYIEIEGVGKLEKAGSTLFFLSRSSQQRAFILLTDTRETLAASLEILLEGKLSACQLDPEIALCYFLAELQDTPTPTKTPRETATATPTPTPINEQ